MQTKHLPPGTVTPFQARIYALVQQIPRGKVCSYAALARAASRIPSPPTTTTTTTSFSTTSNRPLPKPRNRSASSRAVAAKCSPRAVGSALRRNPFAPEVPCHRVLGSTGFIAGFRGTWDKKVSADGGLGITQTEKRDLLREEGVEFDERGFLVKGERCWWDGFDVGRV